MCGVRCKGGGLDGIDLSKHTILEKGNSESYYNNIEIEIGQSEHTLRALKHKLTK